MLLGLEDVEQAEADRGRAGPKAHRRRTRQARAHKRRINRGALPAHLPRIEIVVDIDDKTCPCCQGELHRIGEDRSERLDIVPAQFRVLVTRRPKYACRACEDGVVQAPAPARLIEGGLPTEATVAQVLVSKYADHLPLYRQAQIYARQGIDLDRSTLADWVGHAAWHLRPLHERLLVRLRQIDQSCSPTRRRRRCSIPAAAAPRPASSGPMPPTTGHGAGPIRRASPMSTRPTARPSGRSPISTASRASCRSMAMPATASWPSAATSSLRSAGRMCGATSTNSPPPVRRRSPARRSSASPRSTPSRRTSVAAAPRSVALVRQQKSRPLVDAFEPWLRAKLGLISQKSKLAEAIRYALSRWEGLTRFIDDGRIEIDNNTVERSIRPIALNRKNALFAGSDGGAEHWATIASLIETCKLNDVDPLAYLTDVLTRIVNGHPNSEIDQLLPWAYRTSRPQSRGLRTTLTYQFMRHAKHPHSGVVFRPPSAKDVLRPWCQRLIRWAKDADQHRSVSFRRGDRENPIAPSLECGLVFLLLEHHIDRFDDPKLRICFAIDNHLMLQLFRTGYVEVVHLCKAVVPTTVPGCQPVSIALPGSRKGSTC